MSSTACELADLVSDYLNQSSVQESLGGDYTFEALRTYHPEEKLEEYAKKLFVFVVPRLSQLVLKSRTTASADIVIEIGFICHPPTTQAQGEWMDGLVGMVEELARKILGRAFEMSDGYASYCSKTDTPIAYDYESFRSGNSFRSYIMCTFRKEN